MTTKCNCHFCGAPLIRISAPSIKSKYHFCDKKCKGEYQRTLKPVTKEWLYEHYIEKGLDTTQIGYMVKRDPKNVWNWLKDFGIPTRSRGGFTLPHAFKKGAPNLFQGRKHTKETRERMSAAAKADGRVPFDPAIGSYMKGRKGPDTTNWKGGITPEWQSFYSSEEWAKAVKAIWKRDNACCRKCGKRHNETGNRGTFHIHHIISFMVKKLRADKDNLVLLCRKCHFWVHSKNNKNKEFIKENNEH